MKKPDSRSCTRTSATSSSGETYAIPLSWPDWFSSRRISFVMSSTVSDGSADAIEYGTSTLVMRAR